MFQKSQNYFRRGDDTVPRHGVELPVGRDGDGVEGAERSEGAAVLLHLDEGDRVAQHL